MNERVEKSFVFLLVNLINGTRSAATISHLASLRAPGLTSGVAHVLIVRRLSSGTVLFSCECGHHVASLAPRAEVLLSKGYSLDESFDCIRQSHKEHRSACGFSDVPTRKPMFHPVAVERTGGEPEERVEGDLLEYLKLLSARSGRLTSA